MRRKDSILYRMTAENEDCISELICNLMREKYIRDIFLLHLKIPTEIIEKITFEEISTQVNLLESGRPDICIKNDEALIFIENKIYRSTALQENQTTSYLYKLESSNKRHKQMIYLLPKGYNHLGEIENSTKERSYCKIVFWEDFLESIAKYEIGESNLVFRECFRFLEDKLLSKTVSITFKPEELIIMYNPKDLIAANSFFVKLREVIERASPIILDELNKFGNYFSPSDWVGFDSESEDEKGKYLNYKGQQKIFYGLNFNLFNEKPENRDFLLAVAISLDILNIERVDNLIIERKCIKDNHWCYIKLDKFILIEENNGEAFANNVIEIMKKVLL